ncbi:MAG: phosphonate metabolism protein/1,5-bisphosphokinase (PRPP-forming) PhnN [Kiloniellales bacterium]
MTGLEPLFSLLRDKGGARYGGEAVTQLQHALQAAHLAESAGASDAQIVAALLHDIGHMRIDDEGLAARGRDGRHEEAGAAFLRLSFGPSVTEPVRLHVDAKRTLCAIDPNYVASLSPASLTSLRVQGGPYSPRDAEAFRAFPFAEEALALRRWDDLAKDPAATAPDLQHFKAKAEALSAAWLKGRLILVVGPSGAGKDTLIRAASEKLTDRLQIHFPKRVVTRPSDEAREEHASLSPEAFRRIERRGGFCLSWQAHGLSYGIPTEVQHWLERGESVVVNASRTVVTAASRRFPNLSVIHVTASPEVIARRLATRQGTLASDRQHRLARKPDWQTAHIPVFEVVNDDSLTDSLEIFLTYL